MPVDDAQIFRRAEQLYHAWTAVEDGEPSRSVVLTFADLVALLTDGRPLSPDQHRALFASPRLRAEFDSLKHSFATTWRSAGPQVAGVPSTAATSLRILELPIQIAAADDPGADFHRQFEGGTLRICAAGVGEQVYLTITLEDPGIAPRALLLESKRHNRIERLTLPERDADGEILIIKDLADAEDAVLVGMLRDPGVLGTFLS